jgi:hypothetical protein
MARPMLNFVIIGLFGPFKSTFGACIDYENRKMTLRQKGKRIRKRNAIVIF